MNAHQSRGDINILNICKLKILMKPAINNKIKCLNTWIFKKNNYGE